TWTVSPAQVAVTTSTPCWTVLQGAAMSRHLLPVSLPVGSTNRSSHTQGGGAASGEVESTFPVTGSHPLFPGPCGQPHQFCVASTVGVVCFSIPTTLPAVLLLFAVTSAMNALPGWMRSRIPASVAPLMSLHVSVPFEFPAASANETTRMPTFPGSIVLDATVASPSSRRMPSKRLSVSVLPEMVVGPLAKL